jgi:hypothetical protein
MLLESELSVVNIVVFHSENRLEAFLLRCLFLHFQKNQRKKSLCLSISLSLDHPMRYHNRFVLRLLFFMLCQSANDVASSELQFLENQSISSRLKKTIDGILSPNFVGNLLQGGSASDKMQFTTATSSSASSAAPSYFTFRSRGRSVDNSNAGNLSSQSLLPNEEPIEGTVNVSSKKSLFSAPQSLFGMNLSRGNDKRLSTNAISSGIRPNSNDSKSDSDLQPTNDQGELLVFDNSFTSSNDRTIEETEGSFGSNSNNRREGILLDLAEDIQSPIVEEVEVNLSSPKGRWCSLLFFFSALSFVSRTFFRFVFFLF